MQETSLGLGSRHGIDRLTNRRARGAGPLPPPDDAPALALLTGAELPLLDAPDRARDLARVHLAILKLADGDLAELEKNVRLAEQDWRDVLLAAGLEQGDWPEVLAASGYRVPEEASS